jgi:vacuolar protein sorting-associated protein 54
MLRDVEYFKTRIGGLDGAGDIGDYMVRLVKEKSVPRAVIPEPPAATSTNGTTASSERAAEDIKADLKNNDVKAE